ncbi:MULTISPECIES: phage antirepressor [Bacillota]|uniref:Phage antirepressor n=2 Tax=Bacillota TaxID=1239 RepID=A0A9X2S4F9_9FIRM|nr:MULTISPECIES: phage antirepressor [Bacillota]MCR2043725.1 phage antirepressor [Anaerosalibacter massiliensis]OPJ64858.1 phage antirepressor protein KilAC domain protein [Clostridium oryzae]
MNKLTIFNYEGNNVRTILKEGSPWWVLKDVCAVLGISKYRDAAERLDADEREPVRVDTPGGPQEMTCINESGLYNLILRSDKPGAKKFKRWVTHEVLPSIRRHGLYATDELLANPDFLIKALQELKAARAKNAELTTTISIQEQQIAEMKPKASYYDVVLNCKDAVSITTIAKDYGKSGRWFNEYLHDLGVQFRQGKIWLLYQKYAQHGYTTTKTHTYPGKDGTIHSKVHTYWTQKGRLFIYELLKDHGILPLIEQESEFEGM